MITKIVKSTLTIMNEKGLHTRPCTELVRCASNFRSKISLRFQNLRANAKSLLGILIFAAAKGSQIEIEAIGEDAEEAVAALQQLAKDKFYMNY